ncbi:saccharopine dehydrogenase family protein [Streptomyces sp. EN23]|uniref:saccharopine dehydrogenase family protein n=1 Tax=Streptomyces sp. EN23 TaxID=212774 RepID=UPI000851BB76|nr:saccharopine dehydrogenase NADP-binding domain-containing protein [Streptomyces sp. EN23]
MAGKGQKPNRVIVIGAAGEMSRIAVERLAIAPGGWELVLTDIRPENLEPLTRKLPVGKATVQRLDLFDGAALRSLIDGAALVLLGAGPYIRTSSPVIEACLDAKVPYLDFDDDVESTEHALSLDQKAKAAGIPIYLGCGASPGLTNVMTVDAANDLDTVDLIDVGWFIGDERPNVGRAVLEHLLHISAGDCITWENGRRVVHEGFVETDRFPILRGEPDILLYETAHPEPVTLPRRFPEARRIRCLGGLDPAALNGAVRSLGLAVQHGRVSVKEAVDFVEDIATGGRGTANGWRIALRGMIRQVRRDENSVGALAKFLATATVGHVYPYRGGFLARVYGTKDGKPAVSTRRTALRTGRVFNNMGGVTGTAAAAFAVLALEEAGARVGAFAPEDWADPAAFYRALEQVGVPRHEIVETVV